MARSPLAATDTKVASASPCESAIASQEPPLTDGRRTTPNLPSVLTHTKNLLAAANDATLNFLFTGILVTLSEPLPHMNTS